MILKKIFRFTFNNYYFSIFVAVVIFVGLVSVFKMFFTKPTIVYAKVKLGQGLWWATTAKPSIWFVNSIKKGEAQYNLLGQPVAAILEVRHYPYWQTIQLANGQFDVYVTVTLKVSGNKKTKSFTFNRSSIGVGAPIELDFPSSQITGTIIDMSNKEFSQDYVAKTIYLNKKDVAGWEFDSLPVGDSYSDGEETVFQILDKNIDGNKNVIVKAKIKARQKDNQLIFGEEQLVKAGSKLNVSTSRFTFDGYFVGLIE